MPQDILNLGTAAEVMGSYTLKITHDVIKIALLFLPILAIAFVQRRLCKGAPKRASWPARGVRVAGSALCVFLVMFFGYFGPVTVKPKTTYGWAWQNTYYTYGYLAGTHARDKDAVVASMLICEMAAYYKLQGLSLGDVMDKIYADYGYYDNAVVSYTFEGEAGMEKMAGIMNHLRQNPPKSLGDSPVVEHSDYQSSLSTDLVSGKSTPIDLPKSNVLEYKAENGCKLIVRPSGTEPKIKVYILGVGATRSECDERVQRYAQFAETLRG